MTEQPGDENAGERKVNKTRLEIPVSDLLRDVAEASKDAPPAGGIEPVSSVPAVDLPPNVEAPQSGEQPPVPPRRVAKTRLDYSVMSDQVLKSVAKMEEKVAEQLKDRSSEPGKPFHGVENYKLASGCPVKWEGHSETERFRFCQMCQANLYDLKGVEVDEAEQLVFKRENIEKPQFFKREDGKFMTAPCKVAGKRKREKIMLIAGVVAVAVAAGAFLVLMPPPPRPPAVTTTPSESPSTANTSNDDDEWEEEDTPVKTDKSKASPSGTPAAAPAMPIFDANANSSTSTDSSSATSTSTTTSNPGNDSSDQFWQYSDGQQAAPAAPVTGGN
jgi:hypothetical protein